MRREDDEKRKGKETERCIACNRELTSPGLYLEGKGPYGPDCAKKIRREKSESVTLFYK